MGGSELHHAAQRQNAWQTFLQAGRSGWDLDGCDAQGATPLHSALRAVVDSTVLPTPAYALLALGAAPDRADASGERPLHLACQGAKVDVVRLLLALGADPQAPDGQGRTPEARVPPGARRRTEVLGLLAAGPGGLEPISLIEALRQGDRVRAVVSLRRGGAAMHLDTQDAEGNTALHVCRCDALLTVLLAWGADPNIRNQRGEVPLHIACRSLGPAIGLLLDGGARPDIPDGEGRLPVEGLRMQRYAEDFYDGDRLESLRLGWVARLEAAAQSDRRSVYNNGPASS